MALEYKSSLSRYRRYLQVVQSGPLWQASLFLIFSLILLIGLVLLALRPTLVTIAGLLGQIRTQKEVVEQLNEKIVNLQRAGEILDLNRERLGILEEALGHAPAWRQWSEQLVSIASSSGVILWSAEVGPVQILGEAPQNRDSGAQTKEEPKGLGEGVEEMKFAVLVEGDYEQIKTFLKTLENKRRVAVLSYVQISREKDGGLRGTIEGVVGYVKMKSGGEL